MNGWFEQLRTFINSLVCLTTVRSSISTSGINSSCAINDKLTVAKPWKHWTCFTLVRNHRQFFYRGRTGTRSLGERFWIESRSYYVAEQGWTSYFRNGQLSIIITGRITSWKHKVSYYQNTTSPSVVCHVRSLRREKLSISSGEWLCSNGHWACQSVTDECSIL